MVRRIAQAALAALAISVGAAQSAAACGVDVPCVVAEGEYLIRLPPNAETRTGYGAIVYFHGHRGSAAGVMRNGALAREASDLGVALIAPHGRDNSWSFPGAPRQKRDEMAFVDHVLSDALARFPIDPERIMASGFSAGGSVVWSLACRTPDRFAGFAPIAGAFWLPLPDHCRAAVPGRLPHLFHIHGLADRTVPMAGRPIGNVAHQGDVYKSVDILLVMAAARPEPSAYVEGMLSCRRWGDGEWGGVELCLHGGGHSVRAEWVARGWRKLSAAMGWPD